MFSACRTKYALKYLKSFVKERGNDLSTPQEQYFFPGLKEGEKWCLCILRWKEALDAGCAPKVDLKKYFNFKLRFKQKKNHFCVLSVVLNHIYLTQT